MRLQRKPLHKITTPKERRVLLHRARRRVAVVERGSRMTLMMMRRARLSRTSLTLPFLRRPLRAHLWLLICRNSKITRMRLRSYWRVLLSFLYTLSTSSSKAYSLKRLLACQQSHKLHSIRILNKMWKIVSSSFSSSRSNWKTLKRQSALLMGRLLQIMTQW